MAKYRKKPVVIEAVELTKDYKGIKSALVFMNEYGEEISSDIRDEKFIEYCEMTLKTEGLIIKTLEGKMLASWGDYIIKGIKGEFYPCKPEIFEATYEKVE